MDPVPEILDGLKVHVKKKTAGCPELTVGAVKLEHTAGAYPAKLASAARHIARVTVSACPTREESSLM